MTTNFPSRVTAGVTAGGQFSGHDRAESDIDLVPSDIEAAASPTAALLDLARLALSGDRSVRNAVAGNTGTPRSVLSHLSKDSDYGVRWSVIQNPRLSGPDVELLTRDPNATIRSLAFQHKNLPPHVRLTEAEAR
jgi:hypothetical protein